MIFFFTKKGFILRDDFLMDVTANHISTNIYIPRLLKRLGVETSLLQEEKERKEGDDNNNNTKVLLEGFLIKIRLFNLSNTKKI